MNFDHTDCCIVGGGPAGLVLGLLLARAGVRVTVLEKHADFLRDFRGDTVHASTLTLLDELGLGDRFAALPRARYVESMTAELDGGRVRVADLRHLRGRHRHIAFVPQWDFLDLVADAAGREPTFELVLEAEVTGLLTEDGRVRGVRYRRQGQDHEVTADLVVGCDGRDSTVRAAVGMRPREFGVPLDVEWFRLPRRDGDPANAIGRISGGTIVVLIDRGDYFQMGYVIKKGGDAPLRSGGIEAFRERLAAVLPWLADRVHTLTSFDDVKLLTVQLSRLPRWYTDGLLCIGDAAHAMSPVAGVGINLAIQDAVAAARILAEPLRDKTITARHLRRVQRRRWLPTALIQTAQRVAHRGLQSQQQGGQQSTELPLLLRVWQRFPVLARIPAYLVAIGPLPEHAPAWARRQAVTTEAANADVNSR